MMFNQPTLATFAAFAIQYSGAESIYGISSSDDRFTTLASAVNFGGLTDTLSADGTFTIFAPTNAAFEALPAGLLQKLTKPLWLPQLKDLLLYHALGEKYMSTDLKEDGAMVETLNGESVTINLDPVRVNNNTVIVADVNADNGVIHGIDAVLLPTSVTSTIVDIVVDIGAANDNFSTLIAVLKAAGLAEVLSGEGPFTLGAPTNDAFDALPNGTVADLLKEKNKDKLINILKYHVASGNLVESDIATLAEIPTLTGDSVKVEITESDYFFNDAEVISNAIIASNGIIYMIDKVLMPPADDAMAPVESVPATTTVAADGASDGSGDEAVMADDTADATTTTADDTADDAAASSGDTVQEEPPMDDAMAPVESLPATTTVAADGASDGSADVMVGDEVCITGYVMDNYCIYETANPGVLLDNQSVTSLENPELHTFYCLLDVPQCIKSGYQVLGEKNPDTGLHCPGFELDDTDAVLEAARALGKKGKCTTCTGEEDVNPEFGYRATIKGKVKALGDGSNSAAGPPTLTDIQVLDESIECDGSPTIPPLCKAMSPASASDGSGDEAVMADDTAEATTTTAGDTAVEADDSSVGASGLGVNAAIVAALAVVVV